MVDDRLKCVVYSILKEGKECNTKSLLEFQVLPASSDLTGSLGGDQTCLLTSWGLSANSRRMSDMLMVTTTMGMVNGIHSNTSSDGPVLSLVLKFVKGAASLKQGLVSSAASSDDADHGSSGT